MAVGLPVLHTLKELRCLRFTELIVTCFQGLYSVCKSTIIITNISCICFTKSNLQGTHQPSLQSDLSLFVLQLISLKNNYDFSPIRFNPRTETMREEPISIKGTHYRWHSISLFALCSDKEQHR